MTADSAPCCPMLDLVGPGEIAERLGVQRGTVTQWRHRGLLPQPLAVLAVGGYGTQGMPVWEWSQIREWAEQTGRYRPSEAAAEPDATTPDTPSS